MKKVAAFKDRYKAENLFQGSYGSVIYVPAINILDQLSLDTSMLNERFKAQEVKKKQDKKKKQDAARKKSKKNKNTTEELPTAESEEQVVVPYEYDYSDATINVPVPPSPGAAMINPRTKHTFALGTTVDPSTDEPLKKLDSVMKERLIRNQIVYTDTDDGVVYFVDSTGMLDHVGLGHLQEVGSNSSLLLSILDTKIKVESSYKKLGSARNTTWPSSKLEALYYVSPSDKSNEATVARDRFRSESNFDFESAKGVPLFAYSKNEDFREYVHSKLRSMDAAFEAGNASVQKDMLGAEYAQLVTAVLFANRHKEFFKKVVSEEDNTLEVNPADAPNVPHIRDTTKFLPHQSYALSFLKNKEVAMVDADPGAGKTLMMLADILDKLNRGLVHRPAIIMPGSLLSDQKAELDGWTQGTMNFIVVSTETVRAMDPQVERYTNKGPKKGLPKENGDKTRGLDAMAQLIKSAPKNTIVLSSYEWIRGLEEDQVVTASAVRYKNASCMVRRFGVDMLVLDESHSLCINAAGSNPMLADAALQMSTFVTYKRCYSGTVAPGSPEDVFLQMKFLDPSVLGSREGFIDKYALSTTRSGKVEVFKPGAIQKLREVISKRIGVTIRRSAWLNELPTLKLEYHKATLTGPQQVVYARILDRIENEEILGRVDPGTTGLELQRSLQAQYANDPAARAQLAKWVMPTSVTISEFDKDSEEMMDTSYPVGDNDGEDPSTEGEEPSPTLTKTTKIAAFKAAQDRIRASWEAYEAKRGEPDSGAPDETEFSAILTKFSAIDKFLNCPTADDFGQHFLVDEMDRRSPKIVVIDQILAKHFADTNNGKVIIFTHYKDVAKHVADSIQMSSSAIYYDAQEKAALSKFKLDPNIKIIVGVEQSIQLGQNLQVANRVIRLDLPWKPGEYEQSIARAYRLPPSDPDASRYSTVTVDLIFCEGTAEITKFTRMISKMHAVRQFISGYTSDATLKLVGMTMNNMQKVNTFEAAKRHMEFFQEMRAYEIEEAKTAPKIYGTGTRSLATGQEMEGASVIETPIVSSDLERGPYTAKPLQLKRGVIDPVMMFYNGGYWLVLENVKHMKQILADFEIMEEPTKCMAKEFTSIQHAGHILDAIRRKLDIINLKEEVIPKLRGQIPLSATNQSEKVDFSKKVTKFAGIEITADKTTNIPLFSHGDTTSNTLKSYSPPDLTDAHFRAAQDIMMAAAKANPSKNTVTQVNTWVAAKYLGYFNLDEKKVDPQTLYRQVSRFLGYKDVEKAVEDQISQFPNALSNAVSGISNISVPTPVPAPLAEVAPEAEAAPVVPAPRTGIPIKLGVSSLGSVSSGVLERRFCFTIRNEDDLGPTAYRETVLQVLKEVGFGNQETNSRWLYLGVNTVQAKSKVEDFSRLVYIWYTLKNPKLYFQMMRNLNFTESEIERIFPKSQIRAMMKMSKTIDAYPEYQDLTRLVFGAS